MTSEQQNPFGFLKNQDKQFDSSMKSIGSMYDNLFGDDKLDKIFQSFKVDNNKILDPIDTMHKQIFESKPKNKLPPSYVKLNEEQNRYQNNQFMNLNKQRIQNDEGNDDDDFVIGDPVYQPYHQHYQQPGNYFGGVAKPVKKGGKSGNRRL